MKELFRQYGGMLIAAAATSTFIVLIGSILLAQGGMLSKVIELWGTVQYKRHFIIGRF